MGGKPPEQADQARSDFIRERFRHYYSKGDLHLPSQLERREFGVLTEKAGMWRHIGFRSEEDLRGFLVKQSPPHVYYSSAYYDNPGARTMDEKVWKGADLIFDLDADHIRGTESMSMEEMLAAVKVQFEKLLDSYLLGDFGFEPGDVKVVFSGGRGYHAHISSPKVLQLNSHERREIVDYITCPNLDIDAMLIKQPISTQSFKGHVSARYSYSLHPPAKPGWKGKVTRAVLGFLDRLEAMEHEQALVELASFKGIGEKRAAQIYEGLFAGRPGSRGADKIRREFNLECFTDDAARNSFINIIIASLSVDLGGETDEPVTSDVKRLIRLPGSLHGKTSLVVMTLSPEELRHFDPLRDAVWDGFGRADVKMIGTADHAVRLKGEAFKVVKGAEAVLPEFAALFFSCQKKCSIRI